MQHAQNMGQSLPKQYNRTVLRNYKEKGLLKVKKDYYSGHVNP